MKIDQPTAIGLDSPELTIGIEFADVSVQRLHVSLDIMSPLSFVLFKFTPGGTEGVAQCHIRVLMRVSFVVCSPDCDLFPWSRDVYVNVE